MSQENHQWHIGEDPPAIRAHSRAKHRVLKKYLERYVSVLTANIRQDRFRLTLVDGFAGGGEYLDEKTKSVVAGSPLIMLEAMKAAASAAQERRDKAFLLDVKYVFVERNENAIEYLRQTINESEFRSLLDTSITIVHGEFVENVTRIVKAVEEHGAAQRAIFLLDQCGYTDVPLPTIKTVLSTLKNAEVILTIATDFLIDYLSTNELTQQVLGRLGVSIPTATISEAKKQRDWRRIIQFALHREIPEKTDAKYYTPFFIRSHDSHRDLWLVHLCGHLRAKDVMLGLHWQENTSFSHYGGAGLKMLGYDQRLDKELTNQLLLPGFYFDDTARALSQESLLEQLPSRIYEFANGIPFHDLFSTTTNESPVTAAIMKVVLSELAQEGIIEVRDETGETRRRSGVQSNSDIILPRQRKFFFQ